MTATTLPKRRQRVAQLPRQTGDLRDVREQTGPGMAGDTRPSALTTIRGRVPVTATWQVPSGQGVDVASTTVIFPVRKALPFLRPAVRPALLNGRG
jgi:hypothetical protein